MVANDNTNTQQPSEPNPDLKNLDRLVGTWEVSGGAQGRVGFEWMEGGFFLIQHVDLEQYSQRIKGIEIIGHEQPFGSEPSEELKSRFYDNRAIPSTTSMNWKGIPSRSGAVRRDPQLTTEVRLAKTATP